MAELILTCTDCKASVYHSVGTRHMPEGFTIVECPHCSATFRHIWGPQSTINVRVYWYANRWYDDEGIPHYFGVQAPEPTLEEAKKAINFNRIAVPVDLVYGPATYAELMEYLSDVNRNRQIDDFGDDDSDSDIGTIDWKNR